jgi:hypothetical protein
LSMTSKFGVIGARGLAKTIEGLVEVVNIAFLAVVREPPKLGNVDLFFSSK